MSPKKEQDEMKKELLKLVEIKECKKTKITIKFKISIKAVKRSFDIPKHGEVLWTTSLRTEGREEKDKDM